MFYSFIAVCDGVGKLGQDVEESVEGGFELCIEGEFDPI